MRARRRFLAMAAAMLAPVRATAQSKKDRVYRVAALYNSPPEAGPHYLRALEDGFRELGYRVGDNLVLEYSFSQGRSDRLGSLAAEIARRKPDLIITLSNAETAAARTATASIPIVMGLGAAPVEAGFAASLAKPGANITGVSTGASSDILGKWLELLREVNPALKRVGVLWDPSLPGFAQFVSSLNHGADRLGIGLRWAEVRGGDELDAVLGRLEAERIESLCVIATAVTFNLRSRIAAFVAARRIPAISYMKEFAESGFLLSYGADLVQLYKRSTIYADKILRGAKPSELAIEQPTTYLTVVNLQTAKALGLSLPQSLTLRADQVIR